MWKYVYLVFIALLITGKGIAQDRPHTILWEISGHGLQQPSWLFGVKHNANGEALIKRYPIIAEKLRASAMLVQEIVMEEGQPALMKDGSCFIAVGLDHLKATTGLITLLRKLGYKVTPVKMLK